MFDNMKEMFSARENLRKTQAEIAEAEQRLKALQDKLANAEMELQAREETIAKRDDIIIAINHQVTAERQAIIDDFAEKEQQAQDELVAAQEELKEAREHFEDCERQVYCMANIYKAMRNAIMQYSATKIPDDLDVTPEEFEEIRLMQESVGLKMHSYKMEDLRQMHEANNEEIRKLLQRYEKKMEAPTDRVVFQLIVLGLRAELQQMVSDLEYGELSRAQVKLHLTVGKYLKIVSFAGLTSTEAITDFVSEYETLLKEILRLEDAYLERRTDFEKHQKIFGNKDDKEETAE